MSKFSKILIFSSVIIFSCFQSFAQEIDIDQESGNGLLKVFLSGSYINKPYLFKKVPYISLVRDSKLADVQILISSLVTGSGGRIYTFRYIGQDKFEDINFELNLTTAQEATDLERRESIVKLLELGLAPYSSQIFDTNDISIKVDDEVITEEKKTEEVLDRWNKWVYTITTSGSLSKDQNVENINLRGIVKADRIAEQWKFRNYLSISERTKKVFRENDTINTIYSSQYLANSIIKSLTSRWSVGVFSTLWSNTYTNTSFGYQFTPGIEYNIFPWSEMDKKEFTVAYRVGGIRAMHFIDTAEFNLTKYTSYRSMYHSLNVNLELTKPWGEVSVTAKGYQYFKDTRFYRITLNQSLSARITKNFSFGVWSRFESIHDQVYLPAKKLTEEERLTNQRQLATNYEFSFGFDLRYKFGSIYNNVVNRRM